MTRKEQLDQFAKAEAEIKDALSMDNIYDGMSAIENALDNYDLDSASIRELILTAYKIGKQHGKEKLQERIARL